MNMQKEFVKILNKSLGEYHDLYVQNETLLLADVFINFQNMRTRSSKSFFSPKISKASSFKNK